MATNANHPLVSVVLPTYDRPEMLSEAVESVATQTYPAIELIVVDDCSSTPAETVLEDHAPDGLRWRCFRHDTNRGANTARNTGIREANGEILAFLDDDDRWEPEKLETQVAAFEEDADVGVVLVGEQYVFEDTERATALPTLDGNATPGLIAGGSGGPFSTVAVRRSVVDQAGLPDERFPAWQDREWLLRLSRHCQFTSIRRPLVIRRFGEYDQIDDQFESKRDESYPLYIEKHRELAADYDQEQEFLAKLATGVAASGLANGYYDDARQFAAKAIRTHPRFRPAYFYFLLALGGRPTYRVATRCKRTLELVERQLSGI